MHRGETRAWWLVPSHMLVRQAAESRMRLQVEFPRSLLSVWRHVQRQRFHCSLGIKHVWQGDAQVSKRRGWWNSGIQLRELCKTAVPSCRVFDRRAANTGEKRGSLTVLFLFSRVGSCISASHLRFQPSHVVVCLFRVYEHCHLVVISKASNYSCLHLREGHHINTKALVKISSR